MNEVAFLAMDLLAQGQAGLAYRWLNAYLLASGDYAGLAVFRFYLAYRAMVRAKISAIRASQPDEAAPAADAARTLCLRYMALAESVLRPRQPVLIITHGLPGSGKTTFSQLALERLGAIRIRSDVERKRLFGLGALARSADAGVGEKIYSADATRRTYARLAELAERLLRAGFSVIVDAAFLKHAERARFAGLAAEQRVPFAIATLRADADSLRRRVELRRSDASEADLGVLSLLQEAQEPLTAEEEGMSIPFANEGRDVSALAQEAGWERLEKLVSAAP